MLYLRLGIMAIGVGAAYWGLPLAAQDVDRRLERLEALNIDRRLGVLESRLDNIERLGMGISIAVGAQILLSGLQLRQRGK